MPNETEPEWIVKLSETEEELWRRFKGHYKDLPKLNIFADQMRGDVNSTLAALFVYYLTKAHRLKWAEHDGMDLKQVTYTVQERDGVPWLVAHRTAARENADEIETYWHLVHCIALAAQHAGDYSGGTG